MNGLEYAMLYASARNWSKTAGEYCKKNLNRNEFHLEHNNVTRPSSGREHDIHDIVKWRRIVRGILNSDQTPKGINLNYCCCCC